MVDVVVVVVVVVIVAAVVVELLESTFFPETKKFLLLLTQTPLFAFETNTLGLDSAVNIANIDVDLFDTIVT